MKTAENINDDVDIKHQERVVCAATIQELVTSLNAQLERADMLGLRAMVTGSGINLRGSPERISIRLWTEQKYLDSSGRTI